MKKINTQAYLVDELPKSLHHFFTGNLIASSEELSKILYQMSIQLTCIDMMHEKHTSLSAKDGYILGSTRGFESLINICREYQANIEVSKNLSYIIQMHYALRPFFPEAAVSLDSADLMANELLAIHKHCTKQYQLRIDQKERGQ
ncbi:hypothetical protein LMH73_018590 [Vibrio splendidus]|nr:hypothetical protein [Vibrio splendidus]MCC4882753.1 hypothetical protein [Vibrio splendidus]